MVPQPDQLACPPDLVCLWLKLVPPVSCSHQGKPPDQDRAPHLLYQDFLGEQREPALARVHQPHECDASPAIFTSPASPAPLPSASCLSQEPHELHSNLQRIPAGPVPDSSPPGNSNLASLIMAISGLDHLSGSFSLFSWWWAATKTFVFLGSLHGRRQQEHVSHRPQEASFWGDPTCRQLEASGSLFVSSDVRKLLEILISKKVEQMWKAKEDGSLLKEMHPGHCLNSLGNLLRSPRDKQAATISQPLCGLKYKPVQPLHPQQLSYPKVFGDHLEQEYSQLFWGLPSLHSESLVANAYVSRFQNPSVKFNTSSSSPVQIHSSPQPHKLETPHHVPCFPTKQPISSPSEVRTCKTSCPTSQQRARSIIPTYNEQMEWPFQQPEKGRRAILSRCQNSQELTGQPTLNHPQDNQEDTTSCCTFQEKTGSILSTENQQIEWPLQKQQKQRRTLVSHFPNPQEVTGQPTPKLPQGSQASHTYKASSTVPDYYNSSKLREPPKQQSQVRFFKDECQDGPPYRAQASWKVIQPQGQFLQTCQCQAKDRHQPCQTCQSSAFTCKGNNEEQIMGSMRSRRIFGKGSVRFKLDKPIKNVGQDWKCSKDIVWSPGSTSMKLLESKKSESSLTTSGRGDYENYVTKSSNKKYLEKNLKAHLGRKLGQIQEGKIPVKVRRSLFAVNCASPKFDTHPKPRNLTTSKGQRSFTDTTRELSFLDPHIRLMLETHIIRFRVRQKWGLHLQALESRNLNLGAVQSSALTQSAFSTSAFRESGAKLRAKAADFLRELPWKGQREKVMTKKPVPTLEKCPLSPSPTHKEVQRALKAMPCGSNRKSSVAPLIGQPGRLPAQPLTYNLPGRNWQSRTVHGAGKDCLELSSRHAMTKYKPWEDRGDLGSSDPCCSTRTFMINAGSKSPREKKTKETGEAKEKVSTWEVSVGTSVAAKSHINVSLKSLESLGMKKTSSPCENSTDQHPGEPRRKRRITKELELKVEVESGNQPQDTTTSIIQQDRPSVLLYDTGMPTSRGPLSISQSVSTSDISAFQELCDPLSRESSSQGQQEPRIPKMKDPHKSVIKTIDSPNKRDVCKRPKPGEKERIVGQQILPAHGRSHPAQDRETGDTLGSKSSPLLPKKEQLPPENHVKKMACLSPNKKGKGWGDYLQKMKPSSAISQSKGTVISRYFVEKKEQEARAIMTFVAKILADKLRLHYGRGSLELSWAREDAQTLVGQRSPGRRSPLYLEERRVVTEVDFGHQVNPKDQRHLISNRCVRDRNSNWDSPPRKPVSLGSPCQVRPSVAGASGHLHHYPTERDLERCVSSHQPGHDSHTFSGAKTFLLQRCQFVQRKVV
ncbi:spermatogenesis-associated protein 31E1-like [Lepus europaeus]|nr:spermatogenesis-associated protein 31E1-like [Lepus europaeus]